MNLDAIKINRLVIEAVPGANIMQAATKAINLAKTFRVQVTLVFNDLELYVIGEDSPKDVQKKYFEKHNERKQ